MYTKILILFPLVQQILMTILKIQLIITWYYKKIINLPSYLSECQISILNLKVFILNTPLPFLWKVILYKIKKFTLQISSVYEPTCYHQSFRFLKWKETMDKELEAMDINNNWEIVPLLKVACLKKFCDINVIDNMRHMICIEIL